MIVVSLLLTVVALGDYYHYILLGGFGGYMLSGIGLHAWYLARRPAGAAGGDDDDDSLF